MNDACKGICKIENESAPQAMLRPRRRQKFLKHQRLCLRWAEGYSTPRFHYNYLGELPAPLIYPSPTRQPEESLGS